MPSVSTVVLTAPTATTSASSQQADGGIPNYVIPATTGSVTIQWGSGNVTLPRSDVGYRVYPFDLTQPSPGTGGF